VILFLPVMVKHFDDRDLLEIKTQERL